MKKIIFIIIIILTLALGILFLEKDIIIKNSVSMAIRAVTGLKMEVGSFKVGIFNSFVDIKELRMLNPDSFKERLMADLPEIYVDYDLEGLLKGKVHLEEVRLYLKELIVVKNSAGKLNIDSLKTLKKEGASTGTKEEKRAVDLKIDLLKLKIGKVVYKDYTQGPEGKSREFKVNIDATYRNITDPKALTNIIVMNALMNTTISSLTDFESGLLKEGLSDAFGITSGLVKDTKGAALGAGGKLKDTAEDATKKARDTIKKLLPFSGE
ncbi:MAG: hypothetical protein ABIG92_07010 [Candidatus Omnitrophota bacterium]